MKDPAVFFKIFKSSSLPSVVLFPDAPLFSIAEVNQSFLEREKVTEAMIIGKSILEIPSLSKDKDGRDALSCTLEKVVKTGAVFKKTQGKSVLSETIPVVSGEGKTDYIVHTFFDNEVFQSDFADNNGLTVSGDSAHQNEIKVSEEKYKKLFQFSPLPKWMYELDTFKIVDVNEIALQTYGYTRAEFLDLSLQHSSPHKEIEELYRSHQYLREEEGLIHFGLVTHLRKDKTPIKVEVSGNRFSFKGKNCMMVVGIDVTERENALNELRSNENELRTAQNIAKIGYWKLTLLSKELYWSDEVFNILSLKRDQHASFDCFLNLIHQEDKTAFLKARDLALEGIKEFDTDFRIVLPDGTVKWIHEKGQLLKDKSGNPISFEGTIQDMTESKLLKLSLEESNQRYDYVTKATFDAIWDWDLKEGKNYWGEGFERAFGYDLKTISANKDFWTSHIHPDDFESVVNGIQQSILDGSENWSYEYRFQKGDGSYVHVMDRCIIIRDKQGKAVRLVGAMQDISEMKNLQHLLDKANRLAMIGSWEIDVATDSVYWSDITKEIRDVDPDYQPTLHDGMGHFKEGFSRDTINARVKEAIEFGRSWQEDLQIYTHKGNLKWIRTTGRAEIKNGKCVKIYGSFQDIDQSKKAELEILRLYDEKNTILESIDDGFFTVNRKWIVSYWNKQAERMLNVKKEVVIGKNLWEVFAGQVDSLSYKKYHQALELNRSLFFEDFYPVLEKWFEISAYPSGGGLSVYFKDITERRLSQIALSEMNENLQKAVNDLATSNAELEQFAYVASHDLQEPLRMITSFLAKIEKKYNQLLDEKGKQYIYFAVDGATRMRQIILDLLEFSRVGRFEDSSENVDVTRIVHEAISLYKKQIEETGAIIEFENLPVIQSYKSPFRQVILNLLSNALKYHKPGESPDIKIECEDLPRYWKFMVRDMGIGIDPDYYDRVFNIFQRLHSKEEYSGTGIGLAIVKKIVEAMGGKIWLEPNKPSGCIFILTIPKLNTQNSY